MFRFLALMLPLVLSGVLCAASPAAPAPGKNAAPPPLTPSFTTSPLLPAFPALKSYVSPDEATALLRQREALIRRLLGERRKYLASDSGAREKHEEILKKIHTLSGLFEHKRRIRELERDLELLEQKIRALEPAAALKPAPPAEKSAEKAPPPNPFRPRYATNLKTENYADEEQAAVLFKLREDVLLKLLEERRKVFESDPKAAALAAEIVTLSKDFAVQFEARPAVREITRELRLLDAKLRALPKVPPAVKPAAPAVKPAAPAAKPAASAAPAKKQEQAKP